MHIEGKCTLRKDVPTDEHTHGRTYMAGTYIQRKMHRKDVYTYGGTYIRRDIYTEEHIYGGDIHTEETYIIQAVKLDAST